MNIAVRMYGLAAILFLALFAAFVIGSQELGIMPLFRALLQTGDPGPTLIVWFIRLPRLALAIFAGAGLAIAGAILQATSRNGLADPGILGITAGAGIAITALLWMQTYGFVSDAFWRPVAAFCGAAAATVTVFAISLQNGMIVPSRLLLAGIGINALISAATLVLAMGIDRQLYGAAAVWLSGSFSGAVWFASIAMAICFLILGALLVTQTRKIDLLCLGDETAKGRGLDVVFARKYIVLLAAGFAGVSVSFSGGVGFVGLLAPHMARLLVGPRMSVLLPASALCGAIITVVADTLGRTLFAPLEIPAGIVASGLGAPWFIWLLWRGEAEK